MTKRINPPQLVVPSSAHRLDQQRHLGITGARTIGRTADQLATEKANGTRPKRIAGTIKDGWALKNLLDTLHDAGDIIDETTFGIADEVNFGPVWPNIASGRLISPNNYAPLGALVDRAVTANRVHWVPIWIDALTQIDALICEVTTVLSGGVRMGIFSTLAGSSLPDQPLVETATTTLGALGIKTLSITPWTCPDAGWYQLALCSKTAMGLRGSVTGANLTSIYGSTATNFVDSYAMAFQDISAGWSTLPSPAAASYTGNTYTHMGARVV